MMRVIFIRLSSRRLDHRVLALGEVQHLIGPSNLASGIGGLLADGRSLEYGGTMQDRARAHKRVR
jgi:hypothetical protein